MNIHVKIGEQIFEVEVGDITARPVLVKVDCDTYEVWPTVDVPSVQAATAERPVATPIAPRPAAPTASVASSDKKRVVSAPLPGTIISVSALPGMNVKPGQELNQPGSKSHRDLPIIAIFHPKKDASVP